MKRFSFRGGNIEKNTADPWFKWDNIYNLCFWKKKENPSFSRYFLDFLCLPLLFFLEALDGLYLIFVE